MAGKLAKTMQQAQPADNELRTGTVTSLTNPDTRVADGIYVSFSPDPYAKPARCYALTGYFPVVGDVVQVLRQGGQFLILGPALAQGAAPVALSPVAPWTLRSAADSRFAPVKAVRLPWALWVAGDLAPNGAASGNACLSIPASLLTPWSGVTRFVGSVGGQGGQTIGSGLVFQLQTDSATINAYANSGFASVVQINAWFPYW